MTEDDAVEQVGGGRGAVHADHRPFGTWGGDVDRLGQRFLADAALALDQDGDAGARRLGRNGDGGAELGRVADDLVKGQEGRDLLGQRAQFAAALRRDTRLQRGEQALGGQRLDQEVGRARAHRRHRLRHRVVGGQHQDGQFGTQRVDVGDHLGRIGAGGPVVDQHRVEFASLRRSQDRGRHIRIGGEQGAPTAPLRQCGDQPTLGRFVVDQQQQTLAVARHNMSRSPNSGRYAETLLKSALIRDNLFSVVKMGMRLF